MRAAVAILTGDSSCCSALAGRRRRWRRWRLALYPEEALKEVASGVSRCNRGKGSRGRGSLARYSPPGICLRVHGWVTFCPRHFALCRVRGAGILLITASSIYSRIAETHFLDHLEWISLSRGWKPRDLGFKFSLVQRQCPFHDPRSDRTRNAAAMLATLHHHCDSVFRI